MNAHPSSQIVLNPVSDEVLAQFDKICTAVEEEVVQQCLAEDDVRTMGQEAERMMRSGMDFFTRMLRTAMLFGDGNILEDELQWGRTRLPVYGVPARMVLANFMRYATALEHRLQPKALAQIRPYLQMIIRRQQEIVQSQST